MYFCDHFQLLKEEDKLLLQEELVRLKNLRIDSYQASSSNILQMWDRIQANEDLSLVPKII